MTDIKFFHKILIIIAVVWILSKLATVRLSQLIPRRTIRQTANRYVPPAREPERRTVVTEYVTVPVQPVRPVTPVQSTSYVSARHPEPVSVPNMQASRVVVEDTVMESSTPASIHIDDDTFRQFFG